MLNLLNLFFSVNSLNSVENYDKIYWNWWIFLFSSPVCWEMYEHCNEKLHVDYHSSLLLVVWANEWSLGSLEWLVRLQSIVWRRHDIQNEAVCGVVQVGASGSCFRTRLMRYFLVLSFIIRTLFIVTIRINWYVRIEGFPGSTVNSKLFSLTWVRC